MASAIKSPQAPPPTATFLIILSVSVYLSPWQSSVSATKTAKSSMLISCSSSPTTTYPFSSVTVFLRFSKEARLSLIPPFALSNDVCAHITSISLFISS